MDSLIGNLKLSEQNFGGIMYLKNQLCDKYQKILFCKQKEKSEMLLLILV